MNPTTKKTKPGRHANRVFPVKPDPNELRAVFWLALMELIPELPSVNPAFTVIDDNGVMTSPSFETTLFNDMAIVLKERMPRQFHDLLEGSDFWPAFKTSGIAGLFRWLADFCEKLREVEHGDE